MNKKELLKVIEQAKREDLTRLDLSGNQLTSLPPEIGRLTNLTTLVLGFNELTALPPEIGQLTKLTGLGLWENQLASLPPEIGRLTRLTELGFWGNRLASLPPEIGQLTRLTVLDISDNQLSVLPPELLQLTRLTELDISDNQLSVLPPELLQLARLTELNLSGNQLMALPPELLQLTSLTGLWLHDNQLTALPHEIGQLTNLTRLNIDSNQLTALPQEIGQLTNLTRLNIDSNQLTALPQEIGQLTNLTRLDIDSNQLTSLPSGIGRLTNLTRLDIRNNQLTALPPEIGQLTKLTELSLWGNQLTALPPELWQLTKLTRLGISGNQLTDLPHEIGQLANLTALDLGSNQLTALPLEIGQLTKLTELYLNDNQLTLPPPEIVEQGTQAIVSYLRAQLEKGEERQWVSKLLVVGEGGVGKTCMLDALQGREFDSDRSTTHGVAIEALVSQHPKEDNVAMQLKSWDFGGQDIYHATHQFFLSNRSLFLLVWNARQGFEQGKLYYWLDTIKALAPDSPVLLVATHSDERDADIPLSEIKQKYKQIINQCEISSKTGKGISELRTAIAHSAANLPLMGETWPSNWLDAANAVRSMEQNYSTHKELADVLVEHNVVDKNADVLTQWLHELGDILYFPDDDELKDTVILEPEWVSQAVSRVLEDKEVIDGIGIFNRKIMDRVWGDVADVTMRDRLLRLMERFDLSYRTLENKDISLVVERLSLSPPDYEEKWNGLPGSNEMSMKFGLSSIPAGIPTWFIARSHRFTTRTHWRNGALFADKPGQRHWALVQAFPHERYVQLTVRGPVPHHFFGILRDGLELTLARFPGLEIQRAIPCPGHDGKPCSHEFDYRQLIKAREKRRDTIECPEAFEDVSVSDLFLGWEIKTQEEVSATIDDLMRELKKQGATLEELQAGQREMIAVTQLNFTKIYSMEQSKIESHCPNIFVLRPSGSRSWVKKVIGEKVELQLYCQAPGEWHPTKEGGCYPVKKPAEWLTNVGPYIQNMAKVLKTFTPLAAVALGAYLPKEIFETIEQDLRLTNELIMILPEITESSGHRLGEIPHESDEPLPVEGASLRAIRRLLDKEDSAQHWGGLKKVLTPEGHYLWLCEHHAAEYEV